MKLVVHDGFGVWCAARRLNQGRLLWPRDGGSTATLTREQFDALVLGLPWQRLEQMQAIKRVWRQVPRTGLGRPGVRPCV